MTSDDRRSALNAALVTVSLLSASCITPGTWQGRTATGVLEYPVDPARLSQRARDLTAETQRSRFSYTVTPSVEPGFRTVLSFIHITDVQIRDHALLSQNITLSRLTDSFVPGTERPPGIDQNEEYPFLAHVAAINGLSEAWGDQAPSFVIHTGDASEVATVGELLSFLSVANHLEIPWFAAAGNHDLLLFGNFKQGSSVRNLGNEISFVTDRGQFVRLHGGDWRLRGFPAIYGEHRPTSFDCADDPLADRPHVACGPAPATPASKLHGFDCDASETTGVAPCSSTPKSFYSFRTDTNPPLRMIVLDTNASDARIARAQGRQAIGSGAEGVVEEDQFAWLSTQLLDAHKRGEAVLVFGHHPLSERRGNARVRKLLASENPQSPRPTFLLDELREASVLGYFGGHKHEGYVLKHPRSPQPEATEEENLDCGTGCFLEVIAPSLHEFPPAAILVRVLEANGVLHLDTKPLLPTIQSDTDFYSEACLAAASNKGRGRRRELLLESLAQSCGQRDPGENDEYLYECLCESAEGEADRFAASVQSGLRRWPTTAEFIGADRPVLVCQGAEVDRKLRLRGVPPFHLQWEGELDRVEILPADLTPCDPEEANCWIYSDKIVAAASRNFRVAGFSDRLGEGFALPRPLRVEAKAVPDIKQSSFCFDENPELYAADARTYYWEWLHGGKPPAGLERPTALARVSLNVGLNQVFRVSAADPGLASERGDECTKDIEATVFERPQLIEYKAISGVDLCEFETAQVQARLRGPFYVLSGTWHDGRPLDITKDPQADQSARPTTGVATRVFSKADARSLDVPFGSGRKWSVDVGLSSLAAVSGVKVCSANPIQEVQRLTWYEAPVVEALPSSIQIGERLSVSSAEDVEVSWYVRDEPVEGDDADLQEYRVHSGAEFFPESPGTYQARVTRGGCQVPSAWITVTEPPLEEWTPVEDQDFDDSLPVELE